MRPAKQVRTVGSFIRAIDGNLFIVVASDGTLWALERGLDDGWRWEALPDLPQGVRR